VVARLTRFGWDGVRSIGERDGVRFIEAFTRT
jgi:hypothetical protein